MIIHSLFGTVIAKFFPSSSKYSPSIQKAVDVCKSKIRCPKRVEERLSKRKLGVNLTDQLKILSKELMGTLLKEKMHHDAIEFLGNLLKHYDEYILDIADHFQTECIHMQCCNSCSAISGHISLGQYYADVAVPDSKAALSLESLLYNTIFLQFKLVQ